MFAVVEHVLQCVFDEHAVHLDALSLKYPLLHAVHDVPLVHVLQFAIDVEHEVQLPDFAADQVPEAHAVHDDFPAAAYVFAAHGLQTDDDVAFTVVEYVPAGQFVQLPAFAPEYVPAGQSLQLPDLTVEYVPATQFEHDFDPAAEY